MPLTDVEIRSAKATDKPRKLFDGGGLFLRIETKGSKLWRMAFRYDGKEKTLSFGRYPQVSLADARKFRDEAKALLTSGVDPSQQKRLDKIAKAISNATTFKAIAEEFLDKQAREGRAETTLTKNRWLLEFAYPLLGERPRRKRSNRRVERCHRRGPR
jgi:Arm DNA-binding domain